MLVTTTTTTTMVYISSHLIDQSLYKHGPEPEDFVIVTIEQ